MYIMRGNVSVMIEDEEVTYCKGNLCLMNRNTMHRETDMSDADILYISIDPSMPRARHPRMRSQVGLSKHHYEQSYWR